MLKKFLGNLVSYSNSPSFLPIFTISITFPMQMVFNSPKFFPPNFLQSLFAKFFDRQCFLLYDMLMSNYVSTQHLILYIMDYVVYNQLPRMSSMVLIYFNSCQNLIDSNLSVMYLHDAHK